jgi:hypothetical protein
VEEANRIKQRYDEQRDYECCTYTVLKATAKSEPVKRFRTRKSTTQSYTMNTTGMSPKAGTSGGQCRAGGGAPWDTRVSQPSGTGLYQKKTTKEVVLHSSDRCYACGKSGHFAKNPQCPNFGQPRPPAKVHAMRDVINEDRKEENKENCEDSEGAQEEDSEEPAERLAMIVEEDKDGQLLGSQYSSEGEDYQLEEYEQYSDQDGQTERMYILKTVEDLKFEVVNDLSNDTCTHRGK